MATNKKGLLLAGIAAFAYYKYSKMTPEEKQNLVSTIKDKGRKLMDDYLPANMKDMFASKEEPMQEPEYGKGTF